MIKFFRLLLSLFVVFCFTIASGQTVDANYEDGNIYLKIKSTAMSSVSNHNNDPGNFPFLQQFTKDYTVSEFRQLYTFAKHQGLENIFKISISEISNIDYAIAALSKLEEVEYAEKVPYKRFFYTPNDTSFNNTNQWNLFKVNAQSAWSYIGNPAPSPTIIAIVDDGMDIDHIDLKDNVWFNELERYGLPGVDDDGNFIVDDSLGYDFGDFDNDPHPNDPSWYHGTHVSGIAGAVTNNVTGIASLGFNSRLMAVKASYSNLFVSNGFEAIAYAAENGANVINLSWGTPIYSITERNTVLYAYLLGAVVVAAAGNTNDATVNYPAAYPHVISVASTSHNDTKSIGTTYGQWIDVCAPGTNIYSTTPGNNFLTTSGTSMAAPMVAGLAALMKSYNPLLSPDQIIDCILNSTDNIDFMNPTMTGLLGKGRINAYKAMQCISGTKNKLDASLTEVVRPINNVCSGNFVPEILLKNVGTDNLQSAIIKYSLDNGAYQTYQWVGDIAHDSIISIILPSMQVGSGTHSLKAYCTKPNGGLDWNFLNDTINSEFTLFNSGLSLPFSEDFENGLDYNKWSVSNPDKNKTWEVKNITVDGQPNKSAFINLFNYDDKGQRDGLITPPLNFSGYDSISLHFTYAWQRNFRQEFTDSLIVYASTDCGNTFPFRIAQYYQDSTTIFATTADTLDLYFIPSTSAQWCGNLLNCIDLNLTPLAGSSSVMIKFETYNNFNNNMYIDNVSVAGVSFATEAPTGNSISASASSICAGDFVTFTANNQSNTATQWSWTFSNGVPSSSNSQSVTVQFNNPGSASVLLNIGNALGNANVTLTPPITINPLPSVNILQNDTVICVGNSITLNASGASTYTWSPNIGLSDTLGNMVIAEINFPITYQVTGVSAAGCTNFDDIIIDTTMCLGINSANYDKSLNVYYDIVNNQLYLKTADKNLSGANLTIHNSLGQIVWSRNLSQSSHSIERIADCNLWSNGIYFIQINTSNKEYINAKFIIQKQ
ncbi:MAG: S8 family serine peptidase [Bacteroidia bacterium]|nr:S8 family serine peptidase [Bacteroidia bacterium]